MEVILPIIKETKPVRFEGNNYDPEWEKEAAKRGLPNKKTTPEAIKDFTTDKAKKLFTKTNVLSERELESRYNILVEQYIKTIDFESKMALSILKTMILPAVYSYQASLASSIGSITASGINAGVQTENLKKYVGLVNDLQTKTNELEKAMNSIGHGEEIKVAEEYCKKVLPAMNAARQIADTLEEETDDDLWPLPKYREMLFIY